MKKVDDFIHAELIQQQIPGIAIGIFHNGQPLHLQGYGSANIEHHIPVTIKTVFQSASIGKMFTAMAVMLLVEDKKIMLDQSITSYLPSAPHNWQAITIRHLLTHTSGMGAVEIDTQQEFTDDEYLDQYYAATMEFLPGERWSYSNSGYSTLGFILNKVAEKHYGDILKERVFIPAGMNSARIISDADIVLHRSAGYEYLHGELKNQPWVSKSANTLAEGSLYLSLEDYLKWDRIVATRALLSKDSWEQILSPVELINGQCYPYGFGWDLNHTQENTLLIGHEGSWQGFRTALLRYDHEGITFVVLANASHANVGNILKGIAERFAPSFKQNKDEIIFDEYPSLTSALVNELHLITNQKKIEKVETNITLHALIDLLQTIIKVKVIKQLYLIHDQPNGDHLDRVYKIKFKTKVLTLYSSFNMTRMSLHSIFIYIEE
ncbi:beta-lactamase family protein [Acinetobacter sp. ANC 3882]|uniref:serine hydrolase domain-containing protein n=1 Tax=Acinetobacter sp. ANC 3882 TaxID=2923423 RepID=UPI001F4A572E|nr:beta-lactamase family protein [Acinetobacter sp. ANC 3882]MCH7315836.1 beta-lactamase family protein [Acinetobacter sp. ANC 3882]